MACLFALAPIRGQESSSPPLPSLLCPVLLLFFLLLFFAWIMAYHIQVIAGVSFLYVKSSSNNKLVMHHHHRLLVFFISFTRSEGLSTSAKASSVLHVLAFISCCLVKRDRIQEDTRQNTQKSILSFPPKHTLSSFLKTTHTHTHNRLKMAWSLLSLMHAVRV